MAALLHDETEVNCSASSMRCQLLLTWSFIHANITVISRLLHAEPYLGRAGMWLLQRKDAGGGSARASQENSHFEVHN